MIHVLPTMLIAAFCASIHCSIAYIIVQQTSVAWDSIMLVKHSKKWHRTKNLTSSLTQLSMAHFFSMDLSWGSPPVFRPPALPPFLAPYVMASYQVVWVKSTAKIQFVIYLKRLFFLVYWESCRSSATYDLRLKAESWSLNFKIFKKSFNNSRFRCKL